MGLVEDGTLLGSRQGRFGVSRTIGRIAMDALKVLVLGVLVVLAVGLVVSSGPVHRVQAADFDFAVAIETKMTASDAAGGDQFGFSVSVSGDTAVVGAFGDDDAGSISGSAYVFVRNEGVWSQQTKLTASDAAGSDEFGFSVSVSGDTVVVGARNAASFSGSAYVFVRSGGVWSQQAKLTAPDAAEADQFGTSVSVSGDTAVVGAPGDDDGGSSSGSAYVFARNQAGADNWGEAQKLTASDAATFDEFGFSVSVSGDMALVGAPVIVELGSGAAYVFERNQGGADNWGEAQKLTASDAAGGDGFGTSVSVSGDTAVVGAFGDDDEGSSSGSAYVFVGSGGVWSQQAKLTASDAAESDEFGTSVSVSGDTAVVGAFGDDDAGRFSGSAYVYEAPQAPRAQPVSELPRLNIREIPPLTVWHDSSSEFLVHLDENPGVFFDMEADPQPIGDLKLEPSSDPYWHFSYTPAPEDKRAFTVTIATTSGDERVSRSFEMIPMPKLAPEQAVFRTGEHTQPGPLDPQEIHFTSENAKILRDLFNYRKPPVDVRNITIVGETVLLEEGKDVYDLFNGKEDIQRMTIVAESLVIRSPLHLPQTDVTIYARELRFEAGARITTTPVAKTVGPGLSKPGLDGLNAGGITLNIGRFVPPVELAFDLGGGKGQAGGVGRDGADGTPMPSETEIGWNDKGSIFNSWSAPDGWEVVYAIVNNTCVFGIPIEVFTFSKFEIDQWPTDGKNAEASGKPGEGGGGGVMTSNIDVLRHTSVKGGQAGAAARGGGSYRGGSAGKPQKARKVQIDYCLALGFSDLEPPHESKPGKPAPGSSAESDFGKVGEYKSEGGSFSWLHPLLLNRILNHAKNDYLSDRIEEAESRLKDYVAILDAYRDHESWADLSDTDQFELEQMRDEMQILLHRIEGGLDYYGNPAGWVPMLSFEVNKTAFDDEIDRAIRQLYLAYWIKNKATTERARADALEAARDLLVEELAQAQGDYEVALTSIPVLQRTAENLQKQTIELQFGLQTKDLELEAQARQGLMPRQFLRAGLTGVRLGLKIGGTIVSMIPVGQPATGLIGSGMTLVSNVDPEKPWDSIIGGADIGTTYLQSKFDAASRDVQNKVKQVDTKAPELLKKQENLRAILNGSKALSAGLTDMRGVLAELEVPQSELNAELERLRGESAEFKRMVEDIKKLLAQKTDLVEQLIATMQTVSSLPNYIVRSILAIDAMDRDIAAVEAVLDERAIMYLDNIERRAYDRLLKFHYYMAKAYEYRVLKPYRATMDFESLIEKFEDIAKLDSHQITQADFDAFKAVYEVSLSEIVEDILDFYNSNRPELSSPIRFSLLSGEIESLNSGEPVTLNLMQRGLFTPDKENIRIVKIEVDTDNPQNPGLVVHPEGGSYGNFAIVELLMEHSGRSKLVSDGEIYRFRHGNARTGNPITWGASYDAIVGVVDPVEPSAAMSSLLCSLLGNLCNTANVLLYSRPAAWADIVLTREVNTDNDIDVVIDNLRLKVTYDYTRTDSGKVRLEVLTSEEGMMPYFIVSKEDLNDRQDGRGSFLRTYFKSSADTVMVEAPAAYGTWQFERWTDKFGNDLGADPTNSVLEVNLGSDQTVYARMTDPSVPPEPQPTSAATPVPSAPEPLPVTAAATPQPSQGPPTAAPPRIEEGVPEDSGGACGANLGRVSALTGLANVLLLLAPVGLIAAYRRRRR